MYGKYLNFLNRSICEICVYVCVYAYKGYLQTRKEISKDKWEY